jgi:hypothetical protein
MANYKARLSREPDGSWIAAAVALPHCWSRGKSEDEAVAKLRDEIRYRIEYCPCSGVEDSYVRVEIEVQRDGGAGSRLARIGEEKPARLAGSAASPVIPPRVATWKPARQVVAAPLSGAAGCPQEPSRRPPATLAPAPGRDWRRWDD